MEAEYTINGRDVSRDAFFALEEDLYKEYEEVSYTPAMIERDFDWDEIDIGDFLISYQPEG